MLPPTLLIDTLKSIPWFFDFNAKQLERLAGISAFLDVKTGETIFGEGERVDNLYIILDGQVAVDSAIPGHGSIRIYLAEALDIIGWSRLTPIVRQRVATTTVIKDSRLLVINGDDLERLCEEDPHIGFVIMRRIANVVATNMLTTKLQLMDLVIQLSSEHHETPTH